MDEFGEFEELDWAAQSPELNPIKCLWDELTEIASLSLITSLPDLTNALLDERAKIPTEKLYILWNAFPEEWKPLWLQRGGISL